MKHLDPNFRGGKLQLEMFYGFVLYKNCKRCGRKLNADPQGLYENRKAGLCYLCLPLFQRWDGYDIDKFIQETTQQMPKAICCDSQ